MDTVSVNEAMHAIGYSASPDNEKSLRVLIDEAKGVDCLPADYYPFVGSDPARVLKAEVLHLVQVLTIDVPHAFNTRAHERGNTIR